jgi:hypothetical protein
MQLKIIFRLISRVRAMVRRLSALFQVHPEAPELRRDWTTATARLVGKANTK